MGMEVLKKRFIANFFSNEFVNLYEMKTTYTYGEWRDHPDVQSTNTLN